MYRQLREETDFIQEVDSLKQQTVHYSGAVIGSVGCAIHWGPRFLGAPTPDISCIIFIVTTELDTNKIINDYLLL